LAIAAAAPLAPPIRTSVTSKKEEIKSQKVSVNRLNRLCAFSALRETSKPLIVAISGFGLLPFFLAAATLIGLDVFRKGAKEDSWHSG
jgi:hypothetical protein